MGWFDELRSLFLTARNWQSTAPSRAQSARVQRWSCYPNGPRV